MCIPFQVLFPHRLLQNIEYSPLCCTLGPGCLFYILLLSCVQLFSTQWTAARQTFLSFTISQSLLKLMSIGSMMLSNYLILCHPLLLLRSIFPSVRLFSNEWALCIRWPKYWNFSFIFSPSNEYSGMISFQFSSVAQSCPTLCDPMDRSMPGFPVHHQPPESTQIHAH